MRLRRRTFLQNALVGAGLGVAGVQRSAGASATETQGPAIPLRSFQVDLPGQENNAIKTSWPGIGCWFWFGEEFQPEGYKRFVDLYEKHSAFALLTTSIRHPVWATDPEVHDRIKAAAEYARAHGMGIVMALDAPFGRDLFARKYPDELQEILLLREVDLEDSGQVSSFIESVNGGSYGYGTRGYDSVSGRLVRVYSYISDAEGIEPDSVRDITSLCRIEQADAKGVKTVIACSDQDKGRKACVMAAFTIYTPAVFAPHFSAFERELLEQYSDVTLAGADKGEWGFMPSNAGGPNSLWFSRFMAEAYTKRRPGHDLVRDFLLMSKGEKGRELERNAAINHYMEMYWQGHSGVETRFYHSIKEVFGNDAVVGTHSTWYPYPTAAEVFRHGLDWWAVKRDLAQTDESTPFCVRTALAKKWHSPLWYNMYYSRGVEDYEQDLWRHALGGGRMNFHPCWPHPVETLTTSLLSGRLLQADCRVRLLNYISTAPIDCPIAVIFGHPCAVNWADGGLADVGIRITDALWKDGYYADLIPSSDIAGGALKIGPDGMVQYGPQKYVAAVLYHPQFERPAVAEFFRKAASGGRTALFRVGDWTIDFDGNAFDGNAALPGEMKAGDASECVRDVISHARSVGVEPQTTCTMRGPGFRPSMMPERSGHCHLLDGTVILASGEKDVMGDPIQRIVRRNGGQAFFDAVGIAAVRFNNDGELEAMAAGGLKGFGAGGIVVDLEKRVDVALWRDKQSRWQGVVQGCQGAIPEQLTRITSNWTRLRFPTPLE